MKEEEWSRRKGERRRGRESSGGEYLEFWVKITGSERSEIGGVE